MVQGFGQIELYEPDKCEVSLTQASSPCAIFNKRNFITEAASSAFAHVRKLQVSELCNLRYMLLEDGSQCVVYDYTFLMSHF